MPALTRLWIELYNLRSEVGTKIRRHSSGLARSRQSGWRLRQTAAPNYLHTSAVLATIREISCMLVSIRTDSVAR
jgi:hypothetical protein